MKITHFTSPWAFELIQSSGIVDLEGCNACRGWDQQSRKQRREHYKAIGRHVWFTTNTTAKTASSNQKALHFDSNEIGAVRWTDYKQRFKNSKTKKAWADAIDESARYLGDNSDDYWLVSKPIPLSKMLETVE